MVAARCHHTFETHSRTHARTPNPRRKTIKNYSHTAAKETQKITKKRRKIHDHARTHRSSLRETLIVFVRFTLSACVSITCEKVTELGFNFTSLLLLIAVVVLVIVDVVQFPSRENKTRTHDLEKYRFHRSHTIVARGASEQSNAPHSHSST